MAKEKLEKTEKRNPVKKSLAKERMKNALMFLPNLVRLCGRLLKDSRVPAADKALFAGAIIYAIMPLDFIPDVLPFIGQLDDTYLIALTLLRLISRTDEAVVRENWSGGGDVVKLIDSIASLAPMLLPKRVSRVLSSEVKIAPAAKKLFDLKKNKESLLTEIPQGETRIDSSSGGGR